MKINLCIASILFSSLFNFSSNTKDITIFCDVDFLGEIEKKRENDIGGIDSEIVIQALKAKNISFKLALSLLEAKGSNY